MATVPPKALILGVYGAFSRRVNPDGWLAVASLVTLLADVGVDEPAVRQAVSRMKRAGQLESSRRGGAVGYAPSTDLRAVLDEGDRRIFGHPTPASLTDGWVVVVFSVPEGERHLRHLLRSRLARRGFGNLAPGVWLAPARLRPDAEAVVVRLGVAAYVDVFDATHHGLGDVAAMVARSWDLPGLAARYAEFLADHAPTLARWRGRRDGDPRAAYVDYLAALTAWRRMPYLDPGLPAEVLPEGWTGGEAAEVFHALRERLDGPACAYVASVT